MQRIQFYPSANLANILGNKAKKAGVSVSSFVTDLLNEYYGLAKKSTVTSLTKAVLVEIEEYINNSNGPLEFDLNKASATYRNISMTCGKKPSTIRASIGRSFKSKTGKPPFSNIRPCIVNGKNKLSINNALMYEKF